MRFLVDASLSPIVAEKMKQEGFDVVHVRDYGMQESDDEEIFERARDEDRIIIAADTDFSNILALRDERKPSVLLFHRLSGRRPERQAAFLLANLPVIEMELKEGCIAVFEEKRLRIRRLPIGSGRSVAPE